MKRMCGLFTFLLLSWAALVSAQTFFLQGEKGPPGDSLECAGNDCTTSKNLTVTGSFTASGTLTLPDCPSGYEKDGSRTDIVLCRRGFDEMVKVGDFWIDRYESIIVDEVTWNGGKCDGDGNAYGSTSDNWSVVASTFPFTGNWTARLYACSKTGVTPSRYMTWFQAQEAAAGSGKRLCTNEEWQAATAGTVDPGSYDGTSGGACHTSGANARASGSAGTVPGASNSCVSRWGTEDMIGNLWEWVAMWGQAGRDMGIAQGGYAGNVTTGNGWAGFSPETSGDGDGTWNLNGEAAGCDRTGANCTYKTGLPFAAQRGGGLASGTKAGAFAIIFGYAPSYRNPSVGLRACRGR
ncbi:MAG: SUMF1/EgtB/PvdO family nonheme iron enzyme [Deltaproteobacteria bacterium]|nr:SUMF1/EgtB/PvdO family nonheme iron enzyme [Deltaproteobacteria bacterium]